MKTDIHTIFLLAIVLVCQVPGAPERSKELGYVLRYWMGQSPPTACVASRQPHLQLFHRGDMQWQYVSSLDELDQRLKPKVQRVIETLANRGVRAVLVFPPTKASQERERLPDKLPSGDIWARKPVSDAMEAPEQVFRRLSAYAPNHAIDLREVFERYAIAHPGATFYPPWDYHWNGLGSALAAKAIGEHFGRNAQVSVAGDRSAVTAGYLLGLYQLPAWFIDSQAEFHWRAPSVQVTSPDVPGFPTRIVLAGSSFSLGNGDRDFARFLQEVFHRPIENFALTNGGYRLSFDRMRAQSFAFLPGDLLVWEISLCCMNLDDAEIVLP